VLLPGLRDACAHSPIAHALLGARLLASLAFAFAMSQDAK
jgi:hypothetical protein